MRKSIASEGKCMRSLLITEFHHIYHVRRYLLRRIFFQWFFFTDFQTSSVKIWIILLKHSSNTEVIAIPPSEIMMLQLKNSLCRRDANYVQELRIFLVVLEERNIRLNFQIKSVKISNGETQSLFDSL